MTGSWKNCLMRSLTVRTPQRIEYYLAPQIKEDIRWAGHVAACVGGMRSTYKIIVEKSEEKRPLGRPRHRAGESENGSWGCEVVACALGWSIWRYTPLTGFL